MSNEPSESLRLHGNDSVDPLARRITELEKFSLQDVRGYRRWRRRYEAMHYVLGVTSTALAAVAGATAFANSVSTVIIGACAAGAAALTAVQTLVGAERRARFNQTQQYALARIADRACILRDVKWERLSEMERLAEYQKLSDDYYVEREKAPQ
jgi:hypothetical protein